MSNSKSITIITTTDNFDTKGALPLRPTLPKQISVESEAVTKSLLDFIQNFNQVFQDAPSSNNFYVDEIELSLAINASGGIELIGKATAGVEGGIKVTLKRDKGGESNKSD